MSHVNHPKQLASDAVTLVASVDMLRYYMENILRDAERIKGLPKMKLCQYDQDNYVELKKKCHRENEYPRKQK